jgi:hypothetical protein
MDPETLPHGSPARRFAGRGAAWASPCVAVLLFIVIWIDANGRMPVQDTQDHNRRIRDTADALISASVGDWIGKFMDSPPAVTAILKPNKLVNCVYSNVRTGESACLLFVHCGDGRDLLGHFPPVCYPSHGQPIRSSETRDWTLGGVTITGMRYHFDGIDGPFGQETVVDNFMVLPDGSFGRDMNAARAVVKDRRLRVFGAGEVQVVTQGAMSDAHRDEVFRSLIEPVLPLFDCVRKDDRKEVNGD